MMEKIRLAIVIPCYNEEEVLSETNKRIGKVIKELINDNKISENSYVAYVDDGSKDKTWSIIEEFYQQYDYVQGIKLSRNRGHQNALLGGLMSVKDHCDAAISIDADLQDDVEAIKAMVDEYYKGSEVVYGVRSARKTDTFFKRVTAEGFYKVMDKMGTKTVFNHADYRLMSKRVLDELANYKEVNLFLRGIIPTIGFKTSCVYYERAERFAGESKYPLKKMLAFAFEGITSFSTTPIRLIMNFGIFMAFMAAALCVGFSIYGIFESINWTRLFLFTSIFFIGGLQLAAIGLVGQYVGKAYIETKERPRFIIEKHLIQEEK